MTASPRKDPAPRELGQIRERGSGSTRLEAFSDGVFAISATLLVVSLEVPRTYAELVDNLWGFVSFGFSFAMLVLIWVCHNGFFRRYGLQDGWTVLLNSVLLFVVLFYVYPLKFISTGVARSLFGAGASANEPVIGGPDDLASLFVIYGLGFAAVFGCFALLYLRALRCADRLGLDRYERFDTRFWIVHHLVYVALAFVSVAVALAGWGITVGGPGWVYGLIGPAQGILSVVMSRKRKALAGGPAR